MLRLSTVSTRNLQQRVRGIVDNASRAMQVRKGSDLENKEAMTSMEGFFKTGRGPVTIADNRHLSTMGSRHLGNWKTNLENARMMGHSPGFELHTNANVKIVEEFEVDISQTDDALIANSRTRSF